MRGGDQATDALLGDVAAHLREMIAADARESRLVLRCNDAWLVVVREPGARSWRLEAPASHRLPSRLRLTQARGQALRQRGFAKGQGSKGDFVRNIEGVAERTMLTSLPLELLELLSEIYLSSPEHHGLELSLVHDDRDHPRNPELLDAMRLASQRKDETGRMAVYNAMANATFLVPLRATVETPAASPGDDPQWLVAERKEHGPVFDLFTDWENFRVSHPLEHHYEPVHGSDLFDRAQALGAVGLNFNPFGAIGGQLYAVEIANMVTAIRRWRAGRAELD